MAERFNASALKADKGANTILQGFESLSSRHMKRWQSGRLHPLGKRKGITASEVRILFFSFYGELAERLNAASC